MNSGVKTWLSFLLMTLMASLLAFAAILLLKDSFIAQVKPAEMVSLVSGNATDREVERLQAVRERVMPALFPVLSRGEAVAVAVGLTSDGYLLTTLPVPTDAVIRISEEGKPLPVLELHKDEVLGLAVIKIAAERLPVARFGASVFVAPGTDVHVVSPAMVERATISANGLVKGRTVFGASEPARRFLVSTDFALPGSAVASGDSLLGIVTDPRKATVLPSDAVSPMISRFLKSKRISHPTVGMEISPQMRGALVKSVKRGSAAEAAGMKVGDILMYVEREAIQRDRLFSELIEGFDPLSSVEITLMRGGAEVRVTLPLSEAVKTR